MTDTYSPGTPIWVDLGATDAAAAADFYRQLFGWEHRDLGPDMGDYGMFLAGDKQVAGIGPASDPDRGASWATYFAVADVDQTAARVEGAGGSVVVPVMDVMDQGRMGVFRDPSGAFFSAWQAGAMTGADLFNEPVSLTWNELETTDLPEATEFYRTVLGVGTRDVDLGGGPAYTLLEVDGRPVAGAMQSEARPAWSVYFSVADTDATFAKALELGATSVREPQDSPPGRFATLDDPQGARFTVMVLNPDFSL